MGNFGNDSSIEGDVYVQRLATYIRKNEEALANGLLCFLKSRSSSKVRPLRMTFTIHHLYYISERIENSTLGVDVGPLNIKLDSPNHEPTFISFMANNARTQRQFESDARSITSMNSVKSIVSSASVYWRSFSFSKDPKIIHRDIKYLYSSFTKIPCLILSPKTKIYSISGYEEYPCDTLVPLKMFKNLQVLELVEYEPNEVFGWHVLSEQLRILIIRNSKVSDLALVLYGLVIDDENGRSSFSNPRQSKRHDAAILHENLEHTHKHQLQRRERAFTASASPYHRDLFLADLTFPLSTDLAFTASSNPLEREYAALPESKWFYLRQLTVSEGSITSIPSFVFKPLTNLVKLNLANNLLEELPPGLDQLTSVKYLNFADNYITSLHNLPTNLKNLTTLSLNNNKITSIEGIEKIEGLEKIDLRRNKLSSIAQLRPLIDLFRNEDSKLGNIFISSNPLPKAYRAELFNLFNGVRFPNSMKIDDSRPGYFENALLLDREEAVKKLKKFLEPEAPEFKAKSARGSTTTKAANGTITPKTQESPKTHRHTQSIGNTSDLAHSVRLLDLKAADVTTVLQKHSSQITTKSTTGPMTPPAIPGDEGASHLKAPLQNNQNLNNQSQFSTSKFSSMTRHSFSPPMLHPNGSATTLKSSATLNKIDLESTGVNNPAPNVITPVQVQVEGFQ